MKHEPLPIIPPWLCNRTNLALAVAHPVLIGFGGYFAYRDAVNGITWLLVIQCVALASSITTFASFSYSVTVQWLYWLSFRKAYYQLVKSMEKK